MITKNEILSLRRSNSTIDKENRKYISINYKSETNRQQNKVNNREDPQPIMKMRENANWSNYISPQLFEVNVNFWQVYSHNICFLFAYFHQNDKQNQFELIRIT